MFCHKQIIPTKLNFHYIGNWSKVLEFYLANIFVQYEELNRVKFINFLGHQE